MHRNSEHVVRSIAFTLAAWGFWMLLRGSRGIWRSAECLIACSNVDWEYIWFVIFNFTWSGILPAIALLAAYGLFQLRLWGQRLALTICSIVFVVELYGIVKYSVLSYRFRDAPVPLIPQDAVVIHMTIWPAFIIGFVSGFMVLLLLQGFVTEACSRNIR